jgi:YfiH family protein
VISTLVDPAGNGGVGVAFTDRRGGVSRAPYDSLNLGQTDIDDPEAIAENYARLGARLGCEQFARVSQVHGRAVAVVGPDFVHATADALVTRLSGVALTIRVADCVPVLLADPAAGVIGAAHAGRVGLLAGVLEATVDALTALGAQTLTAWIGPHICAECYEVPDDMAAQAWDQLPATRATTRQGTAAIDLGAGAAAVLAAQGVSVHRVDPCTACDDRFYSHRRDHGRTGRQAGVIWCERGDTRAC